MSRNNILTVKLSVKIKVLNILIIVLIDCKAGIHDQDLFKNVRQNFNYLACKFYRQKHVD